MGQLNVYYFKVIVLMFFLLLFHTFIVNSYFLAFLAAFLSLPNSTLMMRFCICFAFISLNLSKSERAALFSREASFLAHVVSAHFFVISAASQAFLTVPARAERAILIVKGVRCIALKFMSFLPTPLHGPSTKALFWSITSQITTSLPLSSP